MASLTYTQLLEKIDTAIEAILGGAQSYTVMGRSMTRANLAELRAWRKEIKPLADNETNTSGEVKLGYAFPEW